MNLLLYVTLCDSEAKVAFTFPVLQSLVVFVEGLEQVMCMFDADVFNPKSSTQRVKEIGCQLYFQKPGVIVLVGSL